MRRPPTDAEFVLSTRVERYLVGRERVVVAVRRHPAQLVEPFVTTLAALLLVAWLDPRVPRSAPLVLDVLWWAWVAVAGRGVWHLLEWRQAWFVATNRRLLLVHGFITRRVAMMPLSKVTDLSYNRTPLGRLLGYGEFVLESAGQEQALRKVPWVRSPDRTYRLICAELFEPDEPEELEPELDEPPRDDDTGEIELWPRPRPVD